MQSGHRSVQDTLVLPFAVAKCERDDIHGWVEARSEHLLLCFAVQALRFDREETRNEWWKKLNRYVSAVQYHPCQLRGLVKVCVGCCERVSSRSLSGW